MNDVSPRSFAPSAAAASTRSIAGFFVASVFLSALLLFLIEPMLGKMLLPTLGGSPHVWNTCMAFFQVVMLAGYAYSHFTVSRLGVRTQVLVHGAVLVAPLFFLPLSRASITAAGSDGASTWQVLAILFRTAFLPFFVLSTSGPLLQRWYSYAARGKDPYHLYAASNAGSLLALLAYPLVIEPLLPTGVQNRAWAYGYVVLAALLGTCAWLARSAAYAADPHASSSDLPSDRAQEEAAPIATATIARWVLYAFVPSGLLLGTTSWITTDVSPAPLLWVVPLALYLVTFIVAFGSWSGRLPRWAESVLYVAVLAVGFVVASRHVKMALPFHLAAFFVVTLALHGRLASLKPPPAQLTRFFLWVSMGGALGGVFVTFVAPVVLRHVDYLAEYPLLLALGVALIPSSEPVKGPRIWRREAILVLAVVLVTFGAVYLRMHVRATYASALFAPVLFVGALRRDHVRLGMALAAMVLAGSMNLSGHTLFVERTPFGILRVAEGGGVRVLTHGTTIHGVEADDRRDAAGRHLPGSYYHPDGPVGSLLTQRRESGRAGGRVAAIGLGTGSLAYYAAPNEAWAYYEIDPLVTKVAGDPRFFHFLAESKARSVEHVIGDARLALRREADHGLSVLAVDAFSSDAIPVHILTEEAFALYASKLAPDGIMLVHVSNRHYRLEPIVAAGGRSAGLEAREWSDAGKDDRFPTEWMVLGTEEALAALDLPAKWTRPEARVAAWRDDYANLLAALR
ncbi:MAG: fused MFS/spermidine synthase [Deltaproteobacteria bacterium]|nr:fused MFS/spermidine synthase [Deltaproteobacteria bacterium]